MSMSFEWRRARISIAWSLRPRVYNHRGDSGRKRIKPALMMAGRAWRRRGERQLQSVVMRPKGIEIPEARIWPT
jgi:hypothetical protein